MRRLLVVSAAVCFLAGCGDSSSSGKQTSESGEAGEPTATIQGCAPQCLPPAYSEPGNVPQGTYTTQHFFAGQMRVLFDEGWAVDEDSTGEFSSAATKNPDLRVIFWEDVHPTRHKKGLER